MCRFAYRQWVSGAPLRTAELDILTGHPDHDILFIATQVARAAGLKNPHMSAVKFRALKQNKDATFLSLGGLLETYTNSIDLLEGHLGGHSTVQKSSILFTEGQTYQMLLRGHAPASEPFRKWVTEEVLPSIRKTGQYNVNESTTETGQQFAGELATLSDAVAGLLKQNSTILGMLRRRQRGMLVNP